MESSPDANKSSTPLVVSSPKKTTSKAWNFFTKKSPEVAVCKEENCKLESLFYIFCFILFYFLFYFNLFYFIC